MEFQTLVDALAAFGWQGLAFAAVILIGVFVAKRSGLVATGDQARIANVILAAVLAGLGDNPLSEGALMAVLSSLLAALAYELIKYIRDQFPTMG
jgi:hypothetical protein